MSSLEYNDFNAQCVVGTCLNQVAGYIDHNPAAQLSACQSLFGFPEVTTITVPAADPILSTEVATVTFTDIYVSTSTEYSTLEEISTSYANVFETVTEYTTTLVDIITTTVPAVVTVTEEPLKRRGHGRRACIPKPPFSLTVSLPSFATSSSAASLPLASACPNLAEYSSACACLEPVTTVTADAATSVVQQTESATVDTTVETVVTVAVTTVVVRPATTTLTSTLTTLTETTTTATSTSTPSSAAVPQTFGLVLRNGPSVGSSAIIAGAPPTYSFQVSAASPPTELGLISAGTTPFISANAIYKMYVRMSTQAYGIVFFTTSTYVSSSSFTWAVVTCSLDPDTLVMGCSTPGGLTRFLQCGSAFYMATQATTPGGCVEVQLQVASS